MLGWAWLGSWCALPSGTLLLAPLQILQYECVLYTWVYKGLPYAIIIDLDWNLNYRPWKWNATLYTYIWFVFINFFKQQNWKNNSVIPFERFFFILLIANLGKTYIREGKLAIFRRKLTGNTIYTMSSDLIIQTQYTYKVKKFTNKFSFLFNNFEFNRKLSKFSI